MKINEIITIIISTIALLISGFSLHQSHKNSSFNIRIDYAKEVEKNVQAHLDTVRKIAVFNRKLERCLRVEKDKETIVALTDLKKDAQFILDSTYKLIEIYSNSEITNNEEELFKLKNSYTEELVNHVSAEEINQKAELLCKE